MTESQTNSLLSTGKAAELLGVSRSTVVRWCKIGVVQILYTTVGKHRRISTQEISRILDDMGAKALA